MYKITSLCNSRRGRGHVTAGNAIENAMQIITFLLARSGYPLYKGMLLNSFDTSGLREMVARNLCDFFYNSPQKYAILRRRF
jgi:hypothetical protein